MGLLPSTFRPITASSGQVPEYDSPPDRFFMVFMDGGASGMLTGRTAQTRGLVVPIVNYENVPTPAPWTCLNDMCHGFPL